MTPDVGYFLKEGDWLASFGTVLIHTRHVTAGQNPEWLVTYAGGVDVDFVFHPVAGSEGMSSTSVTKPAKAATPNDQSVASGADAAQAAMADHMFARGALVLVDKDGFVARLREELNPPAAPSPPSSKALAQLCEQFVCLAERTAKKIARGETYVALVWLTQVHAGVLLPLLEWHARARHGARYDTWHAGRFLEEWVDPRVREALPRDLPGYGQNGVADGLLAAVDQFSWVAAETAAVLGYAYPIGLLETALALIQAILIKGNRERSGRSTP